jgi:hypothetical protein
MKNEGSLPCSQEPATGPYPEPDKSSTHRHTMSESCSNLSPRFPPLTYLRASVTTICEEEYYLPRGTHPTVIKTKLKRKQIDTQQLSHCLVTAFVIFSSTFRATLETHVSGTDSTSSRCQQTGRELFQQVPCFPILSGYFKTFIYKCTKCK